MRTIRLGFKAFDPHELLCHFIAAKAGLYERAGLHVDLTDITFAPEELPPETPQVSCGAALMSALKGQPQRIVFVATDRPMFWLYGLREIAAVADLKDRRVATYPPVAPPWHFGRLIVQQAGLDPDRDVHFMAARDDAARLGLLRSHSAGAALLSSAVPPPRMAALGFQMLSFVGNVLRIPTTGLAVHQSLLDSEPETVSALVGALADALRLIKDEAAVAVSVLRECFDFDAAYADSSMSHFRSSFTGDGTITPEAAEQAMASMAKALGLGSPPAWDAVYDFRFLRS